VPSTFCGFLLDILRFSQPKTPANRWGETSGRAVPFAAQPLCGGLPPLFFAAACRGAPGQAVTYSRNRPRPSSSKARMQGEFENEDEDECKIHIPGLSDRIPFHLELRKSGTMALLAGLFPDFLSSRLIRSPIRAIRAICSQKILIAQLFRVFRVFRSSLSPSTHPLSFVTFALRGETSLPPQSIPN
jgi:hypothetical protein